MGGAKQKKSPGRYAAIEAKEPSLVKNKHVSSTEEEEEVMISTEKTVMVHW